MSDMSPLDFKGAYRACEGINLTELATVTIFSAIFVADFKPTSSLSARIITSKSRKYGVYSDFHLAPAPFGLDVAIYPNFSSVSTSFSPSTINIGLVLSVRL